MCLCTGFIVSGLQLSPTKGAIKSLLQVFREVILETSGAWNVDVQCCVWATVLGVEPRTLHMLVKCSTMKLRPQPKICWIFYY